MICALHVQQMISSKRESILIAGRKLHIKPEVVAIYCTAIGPCRRIWFSLIGVEGMIPLRFSVKINKARRGAEKERDESFASLRLCVKINKARRGAENERDDSFAS